MPGSPVEAGHADHPVGLVVERRQVLVGERPVRGQAVLHALAEVGRAEPRPQRREHVGRAANAVPHQRVRLAALDGVIVRAFANCGLGVPVVLPAVNEVGAEMRMPGRLGPAALVEADDAAAGLGQHEAVDDAAGAGADHEHVGMVGLAHRMLSRSRPPRSTRATSSVRRQCPCGCRGCPRPGRTARRGSLPARGCRCRETQERGWRRSRRLLVVGEIGVFAELGEQRRVDGFQPGGGRGPAPASAGGVPRRCRGKEPARRPAASQQQRSAPVAAGGGSRRRRAAASAIAQNRRGPTRDRHQPRCTFQKAAARDDAAEPTA